MSGHHHEISNTSAAAARVHDLPNLGNQRIIFLRPASMQLLLSTPNGSSLMTSFHFLIFGHLLQTTDWRQRWANRGDHHDHDQFTDFSCTCCFTKGTIAGSNVLDQLTVKCCSRIFRHGRHKLLGFEVATAPGYGDRASGLNFFYMINVFFFHETVVLLRLLEDVINVVQHD